MATINSVLGPLNTADLGFTLSHEHILAASAGVAQVYPDYLNLETVLARVAPALAEIREAGVRTIVDLTTFDLGRDIRLLEQASVQSGVQIIACTGTWLDIPRVFWGAGPDTIARLYIREIEQGIEGTSIKAGIVKVANDLGGVTEQGEMILRAAARAQKATGAPISTHTFAPERVGEQQVRIFQDEGVDLNRVYIGHSNDTFDVEYLLGLLRQGVWLGLDRTPGGGRPGFPNWEERAVIARQLMEAGFTHRIMIAHDSALVFGNPVTDAAMRQRNPDHMTFISRRFIPRLQELGATEADIQQIFVDNPRRFFEGKA